MRMFAWRSWEGRRLRRVAGAMALLLFGDLLLIQLKFPTSAASRTFTPDTLPQRPLPALVLGAGVQRDQTPSPLLQGRLQVAAALYHSGKASWILVSGDNRASNYNEPRAMVRWLVQQGVPRTRIVSDYAGVRTWDSLKRARAVFGIHRMIVVTSDFHLPRALFIARNLEIEAYGVPSHAGGREWGNRLSTRWREYFACHVAIWDAWFPPDTRLGPREATPEDWLLEPTSPPAPVSEKPEPGREPLTQAAPPNSTQEAH